jgi:hypothetical protein
MKRLFITLLTVFASMMLFAQQFTVKTVNLRPQDARAGTNPRDDAKGKKCAIIRVGVVGVDDFVFPDAVGKVERSLSEYVVYVSEGLRTFKYKTKSGSIQGEITFDDWDMEINSLASYDVIFESDSHLRSAIFTIQPNNARLIFNGEKVNVNEDGLAMINKPVGEYSYQITADGFEGQSGTVSLTDDDISTVTDVVLQEILYNVNINVFPEDATVFIDNVPYSKEARTDLQLSGGKHSIRVTATNYKDDERTIDVKSGLAPMFFTLKENKQEVVKHKEERTRTRTSVRGAVYYTLSGELYDKLKYNGFDYGGKLGLHFLQPFAGIFAFKLGFEGGIMHLNKDVKFELNENLNDSTSSSGLFEIPVQLGVGIPFGKYNRHYFTVLGGGYYRWTWVRTNEVTGYDSEKNEEKFSHNPVHDYGIRFSAMIDLGWFGIGGDYNYSLNKRGQYFGLKIAYKMGFGGTTKY